MMSHYGSLRTNFIVGESTQISGGCAFEEPLEADPADADTALSLVLFAMPFLREQFSNEQINTAEHNCEAD